MCEATVYLSKAGKEEPIFKDLDRLEEQDGQIKMISLFGEERIIKARIKSFSLVDHKIVLE